MHTLFDFITQVKGIEYLIAIAAIAGFIIFWELMKPRPFRGLIEAGRKDLQYLRSIGLGNIMKNVGKVVAAPFVGLAYVVMLPVLFVFAIMLAVAQGAARVMGVSASFGWRPLEAYLSGKKARKKGEGEKSGQSDKEA